VFNEHNLTAFVRESNLIEGILRDPTPFEIAATDHFLKWKVLSTADVAALVNVYAPGHVIRDKPSLNVHVGGYVAPPGGPEIVDRLNQLLFMVSNHTISPWHAHITYEALHPFTDGNGRSGRAVWLWQMLALNRDPFALSFLHSFYYQTLSNQRVVT